MERAASNPRPLLPPRPRRPRRPRALVPLVALLALATASGCARSCKNDHPYVPYAVGDERAAAATPDGGELSASSDDAGGHATSAEPALIAPPNATTWNVEGVALVAPPARELLLAIVRDFDGDGKKDALAVVRPIPPPGKPAKPAELGAAEVVYYAGASSPLAPVVITSIPAPRADAPCTPVARLERIGPHSALVELGASCTQGASSRAISVVRLAKDPAVAFSLAVIDPPAAPKLTVDVDGEDRDHDGIDDVTLHLTIEGGGPPFEPGPKLTGKVAFFDRSAGPSRDPDEPEASLKVIAASATSRASKAKDAPSVPVLVQQMRMLYRAMCAEGGAPRLMKLRAGGLVGVSGAVACGSSKSLEDAGVAEVRAFVTQGDALRAVAAADLAQIAPATKTSARTTEIAAQLALIAPFASARSTRVLGVTVPTTRVPHPVWGALGFEQSGKLLVRSGSQVLRIDPETGESSEADVAAWPSQVLSPDGKSRWLEAYHACEGVALRSTFAPTGEDSEMRDVLLPVAPPLGSRCAGGRGEAATAIPIAWGARGLEALVAGQPLLIRPETSSAVVMASPLGEIPPFGSPRSPGAKALALATTTGVLVRTTKSARYKAPDLEPYNELSQCTTNDDASRIACIKRGGKIVLATFDPL